LPLFEIGAYAYIICLVEKKLAIEMKRSTLILIFVMGFVFYAFGQNNQMCGADVPDSRWESEFQRLIRRDKLNQEPRASTYTIPVVFHIVHSGEAIGTFPNLDSAQINSQMTVLNEDFNGVGLNADTYPANAFVNWAIAQGLPASSLDSKGRVKIGSLDIRFCLALYDTSGNALPEPGIDRIDIHSKAWTNPNTLTDRVRFKKYLDNVIKPQSIWDVTKYLNVWVTDKSRSLHNMGVSSIPPFSTLEGIPVSSTTDSTDGIWCWAKAVGSYPLYPSGYYKSNNIAGRTLTHEIGHYLGLRHIWGDRPCANDYCDDTPTASSANTGNPSYPLNSGSCSSNAPDGEMFMNFMDYTIDPYKYMFTVNQVERMQTALLHSPFRNKLGSHGLCTSTLSNAKLNDNSLPGLYPNPTAGSIILKRVSKYNSVIVSNTMGRIIYKERIAREDEQVIDLSNQPNGTYYISLFGDESTRILMLLKM